MADPDRSLRTDAVGAVEASEWEELLARDPAATVLHEPGVLTILARDLPEARARWIEVREAGGRLVGGMGLLERRRFGFAQVVSGALGLYGGPVVDPEHPAAAAALSAAFARSGGWRALRRELVWAGHTPPPGTWPGLRPLPTAVLESEVADDFDAWYEERLRSSRRKERRRLRRRGYRAERDEGSRFLADFHPLYARRCAGWGTRPVAESTLRDLLGSGPRWLGFVARDADGALVGAHVCADLGDELFAWLGTARRIEGGSAAALLIEAELRWCHEHGRRRLNLGTSADLVGVSEFKRGVSAVDDPRWILRWQRGRGFQ